MSAHIEKFPTAPGSTAPGKLGFVTNKALFFFDSRTRWSHHLDHPRS